MTVYFSDGIRLIPDTPEEREALKLLLKNVRVESYKEFFERVTRERFGEPVSERSGENLDHEQGAVVVNEFLKFTPHV